MDMKKYYLFLFITLLAGKSYSQSSQFKNYFIENSLLNRPTFYTSSGDTLTDKTADKELEYLSATFLLSPSLYFYKAGGVDSLLNAYKANPKTQGYNVFLDITSPCQLVTKEDIIIALTCQVGLILTKKYKLGLSTEQALQLANYVTGYYLSKRSNFSKDINIKPGWPSRLNINTLTTPDNLNSKIDLLCLNQGYMDGQIATQKRLNTTLRDLLNQAVYYVINLN
jgi:hypothetical protein